MTTKPINPARLTGEPRLASWASWAVLAASFGLSASTWIALAVLAGFTGKLTLFGITARLAWLMPIAVDGYVVVALVLWMAPVPAQVAVFAKKNTYGAAGIGIAAQSAYHLLFTMSTTEQSWRVVLAAIVGALPPAVAGLAVHMRALIRRENNTTTVTSQAATPVPIPTDPQPTTTAAPNPAPVSAPAPAPVEPASVPPAPTPTEVANRITSTPPATAQPVPAPMPGPAARPRPTRPSIPATSPAPLVPAPIDTHVTAQAATQQVTLIVTPALLARATDVARQYRTEHGTPITAGRLAVRMKVTSDDAAQLLAVIGLDPHNPITPVPTVNGHRIEATR